MLLMVRTHFSEHLDRVEYAIGKSIAHVFLKETLRRLYVLPRR